MTRISYTYTRYSPPTKPLEELHTMESDLDFDLGLGEPDGIFAPHPNQSLSSSYQSYREFLYPGSRSNNSSHGVDEYYANGTDGHIAAIWEALYYIRKYYIPLVVAVGLTGNLICACALLTTKFRKMGPVPFLAGLAISDSFFLVSVFFLWLTTFHVNLYRKGGWCHFVYLLSHASNFLSVWLVAAMATDRYHTMSFSGCPPFSGTWFCRCTCFKDPRTNPRKRCSTLVAKAIVVALAVVATVVYTNISLTVGADAGRACVPLPQFLPTFQVLNRLDIVFNVILPYFIIICCCLATVKDMHFSRSARKRVITHWCNPRSFIRAKPEVRLTKVFLVVCLVFLIFTLPSQTLRLWIFLKEVLSGQVELDPNQYVWQQVFQTAFYTRFATDFILMILAHKGFRRALKIVFLRLYHRVRTLSTGGRYAVPVSAIEFTFQFSSTLVKLNETSLL